MELPGASGFQTIPRAAAGWPQLVETQVVENRATMQRAENRLGRRGPGIQIAPPRPIEAINYGSGKDRDCIYSLFRCQPRTMPAKTE
jgi:hypothetical protein